MNDSDMIAKKADDFVKTLDKAKTELVKFEQVLNQKDNEISSEITKFSSICADLSKKFEKCGKDLSCVDKALNDVIEGIANSVKTWQEAFESSKRGKKFMHDHQKFLATMVFGAVKAGKSTLGNFLAGREWLNAPFDNVYKHLPVTQFDRQEQARSSGGMTEPDSEGRRWFCEGVTDTTGDIQYFSLSGLRWFDSPGTGSLGTPDDFKKMDEMVKEYLNYVDICIFLINSSEPGLTEDMKYMQLLDAVNQEALVVITKSDTKEEDVDENGEICSVTVPKSPEARKLQENNMCQRLHEQFPSLDSSKYHAISISSYLAKEALKTGDYKKFQASGMELFMSKISEKASKDIINIKKKRPKEAFSKFIGDIINGSTDFGGVRVIRENLAKVSDGVADFKKNVDSRINNLTRNIKSLVKSKVENRLMDFSSIVNKGGSVEGEQISAMVSEVVLDVMKKEISIYIGEIVGQSKDLMDKISLSNGISIKSEGISQRYTEVEHKYVDCVLVSRDPRGVLEHIGHFFGKEYHRTSYETRIEVEQVATGTNIEDVIDKLMPDVERYVKEVVQSNLKNISDTYFAPQELFVTKISQELDKLVAFLERTNRDFA